jgi:hypothetical protein
MILLTSTSDLIQVITGGATAVHVHASFVDASGTTITPDRDNTIIASATTTPVVPSPASGAQRNVKTLSIRNADASASNAITVLHTDGTTAVQIAKVNLLAGQQLSYNEGDGWGLVDAAGGRIVTPLTGLFLGTTIITNASGNFTTNAQTRTIFVRMVGGGAGGAGCTSVASAASAGGGGGAGSYLEKTVAVTPNTAYAYVCGAAGNGASGAAGGNGSSSTFIVGATTYTAPGGTGAVVATAVTTPSSYKGGAGGTVATNGDLNSGGAPGESGNIAVITPIGSSGGGGSSKFGGGGAPTAAAGNGAAATGYGSGGSGALTGASTVRTGGNGTAGCIVIDEYS